MSHQPNWTAAQARESRLHDRNFLPLELRRFMATPVWAVVVSLLSHLSTDERTTRQQIAAFLAAAAPSLSFFRVVQSGCISRHQRTRVSNHSGHFWAAGYP